MDKAVPGPAGTTLSADPISGSADRACPVQPVCGQLPRYSSMVVLAGGSGHRNCS
ncbi:hypothetical protein QFZ75_007599 [Streptomyces sp. V3I8]|nr:hypothetical protein [Streptomyces sp. V3I8]